MRSPRWLVVFAVLALTENVLASSEPSPVMTTDPTSINFGQQTPGTTSAPQNVNIHNTTGTAALEYSVLASHFVLPLSCEGGGEECLSGTLLAGESVTVQVAFSPVNRSTTNGFVTVIGNDPSNPSDMITVSGIGASNEMTTSPASMSFGEQTIGSQSDAQELTVSNTLGNIQLQYFVSSDSPEFSVSCSVPGCLPGLLQAGESDVLLVRFEPQESGLRTAELLVGGTDPLNPEDTIPLSGTGVPPLFTDGFESSDTSGWSTCEGCPP